MRRKNLSSWLKGGIILSVTSLLLEIIDYVAAAILCPTPPQGLSCMLPTRIVEMPALHFFNFLRFGNFITNILITVLFYFIIGAIIGLIIGKIRRKKE